MAKSSSAADVKLATNYQTLRTTLLSEQFAPRLGRPLAFWALPSDRRLPTAFLGRTLRDLLSQPFEQLAATAGIGHKKLETFIKLLVRATKEDALDMSLENLPGADEAPADGREVDDLCCSVLTHESGTAELARERIEDRRLGRELVAAGPNLAPTLLNRRLTRRRRPKPPPLRRNGLRRTKRK